VEPMGKITAWGCFKASLTSGQLIWSNLMFIAAPPSGN
jgi:hypothetical protein